MFFKRTKDGGDSQKAVEEAHEHIQIAKERTPEVEELASSFREIRRQNHFAEQISLLMGKKA